uniref:mucin-1 n=1 Tax=Nyctereutes procyonoides TaxID=34880 RepID=UPI002444CF67|nr:mucin-1 [Nyctereutes procyonoides]
MEPGAHEARSTRSAEHTEPGAHEARSTRSPEHTRPGAHGARGTQGLEHTGPAHTRPGAHGARSTRGRSTRGPEHTGPGAHGARSTRARSTRGPEHTGPGAHEARSTRSPEHTGPGAHEARSTRGLEHTRPGAHGAWSTRGLEHTRPGAHGARSTQGLEYTGPGAHEAGKATRQRDAHVSASPSQKRLLYVGCIIGNDVRSKHVPWPRGGRSDEPGSPAGPTFRARAPAQRLRGGKREGGVASRARGFCRSGRRAPPRPGPARLRPARGSDGGCAPPSSCPGAPAPLLRGGRRPGPAPVPGRAALGARSQPPPTPPASRADPASGPRAPLHRPRARPPHHAGPGPEPPGPGPAVAVRTRTDLQGRAAQARARGGNEPRAPGPGGERNFRAEEGRGRSGRGDPGRRPESRAGNPSRTTFPTSLCAASLSSLGSDASSAPAAVTGGGVTGSLPTWRKRGSDFFLGIKIQHFYSDVSVDFFVFILIVVHLLPATALKSQAKGASIRRLRGNQCSRLGTAAPQVGGVKCEELWFPAAAVRNPHGRDGGGNTGVSLQPSGVPVRDQSLRADVGVLGPWPPRGISALVGPPKVSGQTGPSGEPSSPSQGLGSDPGDLASSAGRAPVPFASIWDKAAPRTET